MLKRLGLFSKPAIALCVGVFGPGGAGAAFTAVSGTGLTERAGDTGGAPATPGESATNILRGFRPYPHRRRTPECESGTA